MTTNPTNQESTPDDDALTDYWLGLGPLPEHLRDQDSTPCEERPLHRAEARVQSRRSVLQECIRMSGGTIPTRRSLLNTLRSVGVKASLGTVQADLKALGLNDPNNWPKNYARVKRTRNGTELLPGNDPRFF
jgi:hypothetical protein